MIFDFFSKDGISDNEMLERNQRPEKGKMLIQVKSPKGPSAFVSAAVRIYETHTGSRTELQAFPLEKKCVDYPRYKLFLSKNEIWISTHGILDGQDINGLFTLGFRSN